MFANAARRKTTMGKPSDNQALCGAGGSRTPEPPECHSVRIQGAIDEHGNHFRFDGPLSSRLSDADRLNLIRLLGLREYSGGKRGRGRPRVIWTGEELRRRAKRNSITGCLEWQGCTRSGYGKLLFEGRPIGAHRLSWMLRHRRPVPGGLYVLHRCDNKRCIRPSHLFLGTAKDNSADASAKGLLSKDRRRCGRCGCLGHDRRICRAHQVNLIVSTAE